MSNAQWKRPKRNRPPMTTWTCGACGFKGEQLYDTCGYPYCPACEDDNWDKYYSHLVPGHTCDTCREWTKDG